MSTICLWSHQKHEENNSDDRVVWNEVEDESEEHLNNLENPEYCPETQPALCIVFIFAFDGPDGHKHWVYACQ